MKHFSLRFFFLCLLSLVGANASAHDIAVKNADGVTIYYNWTNDNKELAVTYRDYSYNTYTNEYTENVVIPESVIYNNETYSVTSIGYRVFRDCSALTSVTIPNSVTSIGGYAFWGCSGLTSVTIPNSVTSIGSSAFSGCSGLTSVTIPNSVTAFGDYAFWYCSGLTSVTIPNSVSNIGSMPFWECPLNSINVENGNTKYDSRNNCNAIIETASNTLICGCSTTVIPNSVTSIGYGAFAGCPGLTSFTIPNGITRINMLTFADCSDLTSITIPNSVTYIDQHAFYGCLVPIT